MRQRYLLLIMEIAIPEMMTFASFEGHTATVTVMDDKVLIELFDASGVLVKACLAVPPVYRGGDREHVTLCAILYDRKRYDTQLYPVTF